MKKILAIILGAALVSSCNNPGNTDVPPPVKPGTLVQLTNIRMGSISNNVTIFANTLYLKRNIVTAPIPAFITKVNIRLGERVQKGQVLYELESKEHRALGQGTQLPDSTLAGFGLVRVKAPADGIITTFDKQQTGDYVLEGGQLCTIAESNDLAFQLNVPYELSRYLKRGSNCRIVLPYSSSYTAVVTAPLTAMNVTAQTQSILAKSTQPLFLPENLIVKAVISTGVGATTQVLPKQCVQSDEMMQHFWIMKLLNDSIAVKVPVQPGNSNQQEMEIVSPAFKPEDRIVLNGAYGLADTAIVKIK